MSVLGKQAASSGGVPTKGVATNVRARDMIQINAAAGLPPPKWRMAPLSKIEVGAIAIIVFSLAVIAFVLFSILATS